MMPPIVSALIATDFSVEAGAATNRAASIARETGLHGALVHVLPGTLPLDIHLHAASRAQEALSLVADGLTQGGLRFPPRLISGDIAAELTQAASEFDMIVAGARGEDILLDFDLGRTTVRLVRQSRKPILVVKRPPESPYRRVLVAVDFTQPSRLAAACGMQIAPDAEHHFLNAFEVEYESTLRMVDAKEEAIEAHRHAARQKALAAMSDFCAQLAPQGKRIRPEVTRGYPPKVILDHARKMNAQLIVMGKHAAGVVEHVLVGSVALQVLEMAECDVLVVPEAAA